MVGGLDVFLSSDQEEFSKARRTLATQVSKLPYMKCKPLESRGAESRSARDASLKGVRDSDIYVGVFGREYSELTIEEYREAVRNRKPCFTYVKKGRKRDPRLDSFIKQELRDRFKYHEFTTSKELVDQVVADLEGFALETLREGLRAREEAKKEAKEIEIRQERVARETGDPGQILKEAGDSIHRGQYLASVIMSVVGLEAHLRSVLKDRGVQTRRKSLVHLVRESIETGLLEPKWLSLIRDVNEVRNVAVHEGKAPDKRTAQWALNQAESMKREVSARSRVSAGSGTQIEK